MPYVHVHLRRNSTNFVVNSYNWGEIWFANIRSSEYAYDLKIRQCVVTDRVQIFTLKGKTFTIRVFLGSGLALVLKNVSCIDSNLKTKKKLLVSCIDSNFLRIPGCS